MASHDCFYHSLTTCLGELDNEDIQVTITDEGTGEALVDEATTTFDNGFIGFWLPDDATGLIEVSYQGRTGTPRSFPPPTTVPPVSQTCA